MNVFSGTKMVELFQQSIKKSEEIFFEIISFNWYIAALSFTGAGSAKMDNHDLPRWG